MTRIEATRHELASLITELREVDRQMERLVVQAKERSHRYRQLQAQKSGIARQAPGLKRRWEGVRA